MTVIIYAGINSNKQVYVAGEAATLSMNYDTFPESPELEYFARGLLNGEMTPITAITRNFSIHVTGPLVSGVYEWQVSLFLQNKQIAKDLNDSIFFLLSEKQEIDDQLAETNDLEQIEKLLRQKTRNTFLIERAEAELEAIRLPVGAPQTISFSVEE